MKVLVSWLREFVAVRDTPEQIAATMSVRGFAVEGIDGSGDDAVIDFEVTGNRPDCMSVLGMAREVATAYRQPLLEPRIEPVAPSAGADVAISIDDLSLCTWYAGAVADVGVGPSPDWLQARLTAGGIRPISNIVDITNYVLLELGQPMHAFDKAKLDGGQIRVRTARDGEKLKTLDGQERTLSADMLVIADAGRPVAIAGVMGGGDSEVGPATTTIVFESAHFNPLSVRRTSRKLGLKTEASMRFERGTDPLLPLIALQRACALLAQVGAGRVRGATSAGGSVAPAAVSLTLRRARIEQFLGIAVPDADVVRILEGLGFLVEAAAAGWSVTVPPRRVDVAREVDLIEEIARHYGFDRVPVRLPAVVAAPPPVDPRISRARQLRSVMTGAGFSEAVTFGFIGAEVAAPFAADGDVVPIANPLSENFAVLRPTALSGLIDAVAHNRRREQRDVRLFEIGNRFTTTGGERRTIACAWTGMVGGDHWSGGARPVDFFDIKAVVARICDALRVETETEPRQVPWLAPGRSAALTVSGTVVGVLGQLAPAVAEQHGLPRGDAVYVADLDLDTAEQHSAGALRVQPLPRFPSVTRDISIVVDDTLAAAVVRRTVSDSAPPTLTRVREFDRYQGKGVPDGKVSLSLRLTFRSPERTLTDAEVQAAMEQVLAALRARHGAIQR